MLAAMAPVTPIEQNESWMSMTPPGLTRLPQATMSSRAGVKRWAPSMWSRSMSPGMSSWASWLNLRT